MIAVTGALGLIGSQVLNALTRSGVEAMAIDHPFAPGKEFNRDLNAGISFVDHLEFIKQLQNRMLVPAVIVHLGACSSTTETNWDYLRSNNLEYSKHLWEYCAASGTRLIYASSAATYGDGSHGFDDEADISRLAPLNLYGHSKHEFDLWVQDQRQRRGPAQCVGLKFFNVFGSGESHKGRMASMVYHGYNQIQQTGHVRLFKSHRTDFEDGGQLRDFIYIKQVVHIILQLIEKPDVSGLFNVGTGRARSFKDLTEAVFAALDRAPSIEYIPMPQDIRDKYQYFTQATTSKIQKTGVRLLDISLEDAVSDYVKLLSEQSRFSGLRAA